MRGLTGPLDGAKGVHSHNLTVAPLLSLLANGIGKPRAPRQPMWSSRGFAFCATAASSLSE
jgi:hypothetical protein